MLLIRPNNTASKISMLFGKTLARYSTISWRSLHTAMWIKLKPEIMNKKLIFEWRHHWKVLKLKQCFRNLLIMKIILKKKTVYKKVKVKEGNSSISRFH